MFAFSPTFFFLQCFPNPSQQAPFRFFLFFIWNTGLFNALDASLDAQCSPVKKLVANCGQSRSPPEYSLIHCLPWSARQHVAPSASTRTRERTRYTIQCKGSSTLCPQVLSHFGPRHMYFLLPISDIIILVFISTSPCFTHIFPFLSPSSCCYPLTILRLPTVAPSLDD